MIKIVEDEEDQPKNAGTKAPFSLNFDPVDEIKPEEPPVEKATSQEPVREETMPVEPPVKETTPVAASPWEKIEELPGFNAPAPFEEPEIAPVSASEVTTAAPEIPAPAAEPAAFFEDAPPEPEVFVKVPYQPDTSDETIHNSGLAWSAGIIFFGSVVFMMLLGWGFDLLFGSSPYGLVGGIVFGSLIGFIQFFRISSQIFKK